jgi:periplasmic protein TonB
MKTLLPALIFTILIHTAFLSIKIHIDPKPEILSKPEPIKISMSYRQVKKKTEQFPEKPTYKPDKQKTKPIIKESKPLAKAVKAVPKVTTTKPIKQVPEKIKKLKQDKIVKDEIKRTEAIKEPEPKIEPKHIEPVPKQELVLHPLPLVENKKTNLPPAVNSFANKDKSLLPEKKTTPVAIVHTKVIPKYKINPAPLYPRIAKKRGYQGQVLLLVTVSKQGTAKKIEIRKSSGYKILDKSALKTVNQWYFYPGTKDGEAVEMSVIIPIHFNLQQ